MLFVIVEHVANVVADCSALILAAAAATAICNLLENADMATVGDEVHLQLCR